MPRCNVLHLFRKYKIIIVSTVTFWLCCMIYRGEDAFKSRCTLQERTTERSSEADRRPSRPIQINLVNREFAEKAPNLSNRSLLWQVDGSEANPHPFRYLIFNEKLCAGSRSDVYFLVVVHTHPKNFHRRMFMRKTWANPVLYPYLKMIVMFAMGSAGSEAEEVNEAVAVENAKFHDIIQEDFLDTYRNLTYKAVMWLRWSALYCPQAAYVLKTDDDIFVNPFHLLRLMLLLNKKYDNPEKSIFCLNWKHMDVIRENDSKWYVSDEDYPSDHYLPYCSGSAYLLTADSLFPMYQASHKIRFFWVDDVYVTGLLRTYSGVEVKNIASMYTLSCSELMTDLFQKFTLFCHLPTKTDQFYELWNSLTKFYNLPQISP